MAQKKSIRKASTKKPLKAKTASKKKAAVKKGKTKPASKPAATKKKAKGFLSWQTIQFHHHQNPTANLKVF